MPASFRILVVGAGIVGLTTAISLTLKGHRVTILEKVAVLRGIGGVINIPPNAARVLKAYGLAALIEPKVDDRMKALRFRRFNTGDTIGYLNSSAIEDDYGAPNWRLARGDLQQALLIAAREAGIEIRLGCDIASIDESRPAAILNDGEEIEADLIVGADGVQSIVRRAVLPGEEISRIDHISAYFVEVDRSMLLVEPELVPMLEENSLWLAPGRQVIATNLQSGNRFTMVMAMDELLGEEGVWAKQAKLSDVAERFKDFHPNVKEVLKYVKSENCLIWRFPELPILSSWVSKRGKIVIVGDAAHAMIPYATQGAAMGIEDSSCLSECLSRATSTTDVPKVLEVFQSIRQPRVLSVQKKSRAMHKMMHMPDGPAQEARDKILKSRPFNAAPSTWDKRPIDVAPPERAPLYEPYLLGYDIAEHTNRKLDEILNL